MADHLDSANSCYKQTHPFKNNKLTDARHMTSAAASRSAAAALHAGRHGVAGAGRAPLA